MRAHAGANSMPTAAHTQKTLFSVLPRRSGKPSTIAPFFSNTERVLYAMQPVESLPSVDLSISMKSRFLNQRQLEIFDALMRRFRRPLLVGYAIGVAGFPFIFALPLTVAAVLSALVTVVCLVPTVSLFSTLRYEMVKLMVGTFDFWFCTVTAWSTAIVLCMVVAESPTRAISIPIAFAGIQANVMIDANLRSARNWIWVNCIGMLGYLFLAGWCSFRFIPRQRSFAVLRLRDEQVPAESFVASGMMTICALIARNVLRKYRTRKKHRPLEQPPRHLDVIDCVSYRTTIKYVPQCTQDAVDASAVAMTESEDRQRTKSSMRQLRIPRILGLIEPTATLSRYAFGRCMNPRTRGNIQSSCCMPTIFHAVGLCAATIACASGYPRVDWTIGNTSSLPIASFVMTAAYCTPFVVLYQRDVFKKIVKSFNFLFLGLQITVAHVCVCDFFRWTPKCVALAMTSLMWNLWVLWLDALTPLVRSRLGFHVRCAAPIFALCLGAATCVLYVLIAFPGKSAGATDETTYFDRVLWSGTVFGQTASFRLVPVFYNSLADVFPLAIRLLWRLCTVSNDVLIVLDGAVAYNR